MNAGVIAMNVQRHFFPFSGIECEPNDLLELTQEMFSGPTVLQEEKLQSGLIAALAQHFATAENLRHAAHHSYHLLRANERVEANAKMRLGGKSTGYAQRKTDFVDAVALAAHGRETNVINFRVRAPVPAAGDR